MCSTNCTCGKVPCATTTAPTANFSHFITSVDGLMRASSQLAASMIWVAPPRLFHVIRSQTVVAPAMPAYIKGDVLTMRPLGVWATSAGVVIDPPLDGDVTPLEGEGTRCFKTANLVADVIYEVTCEDAGFTSISVECTSPIRVAATSADTGATLASIDYPAGRFISFTRSVGEPRIAPFFIKPAADSTLRIIYTS